jgi:hypothetical protein
VRRPTFGGYKPPKMDVKSIPQPKPLPAPRKLEFENLLCQAIAETRVVLLRYDADFADREYLPGAVYQTTNNKISVTGFQRRDGNAPFYPPSVHVFEVGKMTSLRLTDERFQQDMRIDRLDPRYRKGIICG